MSKRHDAIFDDVLSNIDAQVPKKEERAGARFLKRSNALAESGSREEKVLRWVDPADCVMWARHNRDYAALTPDNCRDLIDGIKAQGQQEFPAIVRQKGDKFEVICGARRHFAVSWLRANNYPQFKYLIEVRDLTDEEAFRLADIENRDREDLTDFERAVDYAAALEHYYGGAQNAMAERLEVSSVWLSRYLQLAKLPEEIVEAFPSRAEIKEIHARRLRPLLKKNEDAVIAQARQIAVAQMAARRGEGALIPAQDVMKQLAAVTAAPAKKSAKSFVFRNGRSEVKATIRGGKCTLTFPTGIDGQELQRSMQDFLGWRRNNR